MITWVIEIYTIGSDIVGATLPQRFLCYTPPKISTTIYKYVILKLPTTDAYKIWSALARLSTVEMRKLFNCKYALTYDEFMLKLKASNNVPLNPSLVHGLAC